MDGETVFPRTWELMRPVADDSLVVSLEQTRQAMRMMAERARITSEGAGTLPLAAVLASEVKVRGTGARSSGISGGNVDLTKSCDLIDSVLA